MVQAKGKDISFSSVEIVDFSSEDESGNSLLIKWLSDVQARFGPQDSAKVRQLFNTAKEFRENVCRNQRIYAEVHDKLPSKKCLRPKNSLCACAFVHPYIYN